MGKMLFGSRLSFLCNSCGKVGGDILRWRAIEYRFEREFLRRFQDGGRDGLTVDRRRSFQSPRGRLRRLVVEMSVIERLVRVLGVVVTRLVGAVKVRNGSRCGQG
jgi:hypothetical protein